MSRRLAPPARLLLLTILSIAALARGAAAQETVNSRASAAASPIRRAASSRARASTARQIDTNVDGGDDDGAGRAIPFPVPEGRPVRDHRPPAGIPGRDAHADAAGVGSAFDLPIALAVARWTRSVTVTGEDDDARDGAQPDRGHGHADGGREPADERPELPGSRAARSGRVADQLGEHAALCRDVGRAGPGLSVGSQRNFSNSFIVDGLSANDDAAGLSGIPFGVDAVDQFQVVTSGGQAEFGRALGGYVNVVTKSGTNTLHGDFYDFLRDDQLQRRQPAVGRDAADAPAAVRRSASAARSCATARSSSPTSSSATSIRSGLTTISRGERGRRSTRSSRRSAIPARPSRPASIRIRSTARTCLGEDRSPGERQRPAQRPLQPVSRHVRQLARRRRVQRAQRVGRARQHRSDRRVRATRGALVAHGQRDARAVRVQRPAGAADRSDRARPSASRASRRSARCRAVPTGRAEQDVRGRRQPVAPGRARTPLRAGVDVLYNDDTITFPRSVRGAYTFSSLANFLAGTYNNAGFTQTFGATSGVADEPEPRALRCRTSGRSSPRLTLNAGLRYDLQFLETIQTDTEQPLAARRLRVDALRASRRSDRARQRRHVLRPRAAARRGQRAAVGGQHHRPRAAAADRTSACRRRRPARRRSRTSCSAPVPLVTLVNFTTMDPAHAERAIRGRRASRSSSSSATARTVSVGYQYVRGANLIISINQNVPSCVAAGTNNGCRPESDLRQQQPVLAARQLDLSRPARLASSSGRRAGATTASATRSRRPWTTSGEFFFSSPIDPFDLSKDWGRSDDDQRHRLVVSGRSTRR